MTGWGLVLRSVRFHWRANLAVLLGAIVATAILVGALGVGDTVRYSLREMALTRLGKISLSLNGQTRFFRAALADDLSPELKAPVVPAVVLQGTVSGEGGDIRTGHVQVIGVDDRFWQLGLGGASPSLPDQGVAINEQLAAALHARKGQEVVIRVEKPSLLSRDAPLSSLEDATVTLQLTVSDIVPEASLGRFSVEANQLPPLNAFVPLALLQKQIGMAGRANTLLVGAGVAGGPSLADASRVLDARWQLPDAGLQLRPVPGGSRELRSDEIFLSDPLAKAALAGSPAAQPVLTYFVNELRSGSRATPYSMVSAVPSSLRPELADNEILIDQWLADDTGAAPSSQLRIKYFVVGPMRKLVEKVQEFRVRAVLPMTGIAADPTLMPAFPGIADKKNCRDWEPGMPVDLKKIRPKDEAYWHAHRGTPKAFITLAAGQKLWDNRFGNLTSVRYPASAGSEKEIADRVRKALSPATVGLFFQPIRERALAASSQAMDFGQLFLGFSFFLIAAALLLTALLFTFAVEQRSEEIGILLAIGFRPARVRRLLLAEGAVIGLVAAIVGAALGVFYTQVVVHGLSTVWSGAVAGSALRYHIEGETLAIGGLSGLLVSLFSMWLSIRRQGRAPARELLAGAGESAITKASVRRRFRPGIPTGVVSLALGALTLGYGFVSDPTEAAEMFFTAGAFLLIAGLAFCRTLLAGLEAGASQKGLTLGSLGTRNSTRRAGRSLAVIALLASGVFLVIAVGASRQDPRAGANRRSSGTGGFALFGESTIPVYSDLNSQAGQDEFAMDSRDLAGATIVPLRLREGDEASCLNLNRAQAPRLYGVDPAALGSRKSFSFVHTISATSDPWSLLDRPEPDGSVPAIGDENTLTWALEKSVGTKIPFVDDRGNRFQLHIVGMIGNSVLQGGLLISEKNFIQRFPSQGGYQVFLIDVPGPATAANTVSGNLTRALENVGLSVTPTVERLAQFSTVENTYLSIFAALGGLGLLLGSIGLGVVVLRNALERRGELALLRSIGFRTAALRMLVFNEHVLLLGLGLAVGAVTAVIAVLPALRGARSDIPYGSLGWTLVGVLVSGCLWTWLAAAAALRGSILKALRSE